MTITNNQIDGGRGNAVLAGYWAAFRYDHACANRLKARLYVGYRSFLDGLVSTLFQVPVLCILHGGLIFECIAREQYPEYFWLQASVNLAGEPLN